MKKLFAVVALIAASLFVTIPAAMADGPSGPTTTDAPTTDTPATDPPAGDPADLPGTGANNSESTSGLTTAKIVKVAAAKQKVIICHATDSESHPYVVNKPAKDGDVSGHAGHTGPVWYPGAKGDGVTWGDIIPPFDYSGGSFPGLNWTDDGKAIYDNGCKIPEEVVTSVAPQDPTVTPATCDADGDLTLPSTDGVAYTVDPKFNGPGDYTVTATAKPGFELTGTTDFDVTVDPKLSGADCTTSSTTPSDPGDSGDSNGVLPDTGGTPLWMLYLSAGLIAAGAAVVSRTRTVPSMPTHRLMS